MMGHVDDDAGTPRLGTLDRDVINSVETKFNIHIVEKIWLLTDTLGFASERFPMIDRPPIGQVIRAARLHLGHTQAKFAVLCNITPQYLSLLELGEVNVSLDTLLMISEALGEPLSSLLAKAEAMAASGEASPALRGSRSGKQGATALKLAKKSGAVRPASLKGDSGTDTSKGAPRTPTARTSTRRAGGKAMQGSGEAGASDSGDAKRTTSGRPGKRKTDE